MCVGGGEVLTTNGHAFRINTIFPAMLKHVFRGRDALVETLGKGMFWGQTISETCLHFYIKDRWIKKTNKTTTNKNKSYEIKIFKNTINELTSYSKELKITNNQ